MKFYYFNSTHWDREWYQTMQTYRRYLVETTDGILNALENNPEFQKYTFDGQTIVLEDVVEIHPEWRERLTAQIRAGRLNVGPWYVMPDEFLVSGESLIRNLLIGREVARAFGGEPWPIGYICDTFGHIAQTPQIFNGFGLQMGVIWRGVDAQCPPYFLWEAPDGSRLPTVKLMSQNGYADFSLWVTGWWDLPLDEATFKSRLQLEVERIRPHFGEAMVLSDALDHINVHAQAPQYLKWIQEVYPDAEVIHTDYREVMAEFAAPAKLPVRAGELIQGCDQQPTDGWLLSHTLSSRYDIKAGNDICQNRLELDCDPVQARAAAQGTGAMTSFWKYAWKQLVKNHPHDSICGCSIDAVHRQMLTRFEEIGQVGDSIVEDWILADRRQLTGKPIQAFTKSAAFVEDRTNTDIDPDGCYTVRVYNPLPWEREEAVQLELAFPARQAYPQKWFEPFGYEVHNAFRLFDEAGNEIPYQLGRGRRNQLRRFYRHDSRSYDIYPVCCKLNLRASGWNTVQLRPSDDAVRFFVSQLESRTSAANAYLTLAVNADGTIDIQDRRTQRHYRKLNDFIFDREIGDGWNHARPAGAPTLVAASGTTQVALVEDGPVRTSFAITRTYELPRELEFQGTLQEGYAGIAESEDTVKLTIKSVVSLEADSDAVKVKTTFVNTVRDYRLRLVMPTGIPGEYFAYQNGAFLNRAAGRTTDRATERYPESEALEKNFSGIAGKSDVTGGIALVARYGLHEVSAGIETDSALYITLVRAFRRTVMTNGEEDCQLQKPLTFEYAYKPVVSKEDYPALFRFMQNYRTTPIDHALPASQCVAGGADAGWLEITGNLSLGALKPAHSGAGQTAILRLANLSGETRKGRVRLAQTATVTPVALDEETVLGDAFPASEFGVVAEAWKFITYKLEF